MALKKKLIGQINELSEKIGIAEQVVFEQSFVIPSFATGSIDLKSAKKGLRLRAHSKITLHFGSRFILSGCVVKTRHILDMP